MRISIKKKYALTIVGSIMVVVGLLGLASYLHTRDMGAALTTSSSRVLKTESLKQVHSFAESYANILSERLVNLLYYYDLDAIKSILVEAKSQKRITSVYVYDTDCRIVHDGTDAVDDYGASVHHPELCREAIDGARQATLETEDHITVARSIWIGDRYLGGVTIGLALTDINANIQTMQAALHLIIKQTVRAYAVNIGLITLSLLLLGILLSLAISRQFFKPIKEMIGYLQRVGEGDYDVKFDSKPRDEIGELFSSFEQMTRELKTSTVSVTDLKREIRQRARAEAERNEMAAQLQRSQKMEAVGRLASGVAHDLNNMLSGLVSYPELLMLDLPANHRMRPPLETIQKSGQKASAIVQDLLTLARRGVSNTEVVDFLKIVRDYLDSPEFHNLISFQPAIEVQTDFDPVVMNIKGSSAQLGKVVMNLVSNAVEAMPEGGTVYLQITNRYIDRPIPGYDKIEQGEYLLFTIRDEGIGIKPDDLEHIFEPFYSKKVMGRSGTGLGMAVVWGAVKDHRGYIDIKSRVGQGTQIDLYFPLSREPIEPQGPRRKLDEFQGAGETILVVDDVAEQREIASRILERLGYRTVTVESGEAALDYLETQAADLVLLDMILDPGIDGHETYRRILEIRPGQKAVIASGYAESVQVEQALAMGAGAYIRKPYTLEKIGLAVRTELDR